ncbi:uncharacterized protein N7515_008570 [Penicillium bovifimosum]|uniref:Tim44-like domain-containing protein n=1 Tax=Penicillium bovifimosum TaxID=126998 RepID=A0A9W9GN74_9EURO|nr:uncharacterized protein N7515_008570 [Penicillium bovifimosum]KAJ5124745.1 hypothetical protein N7515_008570 [Penicillium bovifimosum]
MASTLRLPAGTSARIVPSGTFVSPLSVAGLSHCRTFAQTSQQLAGARAMNFRPPSQAQPSFKTKTKGMKPNEFPNDIGLMPGTFIRPLWRDMPSIFLAPRDRWHMEWTWLKSWFGNYASVLAYCIKDAKLPLGFLKRRKAAAEYQQNMYKAFAEGDIARIRAICCDGIANKLIKEIERRPKDEKVTWKRLKLLRKPSTNFTGIRVISDRASTIPDIPKSGVRQIVVRITSRQSTTTTKIQKAGAQVEESVVLAKEQDCVEHVMLQHLRWNNQDKGWRIWGTVTPTMLEDAKNDPHFKPGLGTAERIEMIKESMMKR